MLFIGFEQVAYTFSESQATTPQLCVTISGTSDGVRAVVQITTSPEIAQGSYMFSDWTHLIIALHACGKYTVFKTKHIVFTALS